ncbi:MAG TPA: AAA family ATPase, partial [Ktedonobacterales bacterium]
LEDKLRQHVIAQEEAIAAVAQTLRVSFSLVRDPNRPKAVLLFTGPSGVGKTETARALAETLFADAAPQQLLTLDMAEFSEKHMLSQLIGSPPGYVDSDEEGRLTGWLRLHPFGVVLLDEIEKAHPRVRQALLGLFETGRITDARGRTVHGREAIYIMTANLRAEATAPDTSSVEGAPAAPVNPSLELPPTEEQVRQRLAATLSPEFVGRIHRIVLYQPLTHEALIQIAQLKLNQVRSRLWPEGIGLHVSDEVYDWLIAHGVDATTGARHLERIIGSAILEPIAAQLSRGQLARGSVASVRLEGGQPIVTA